MTATANKQVLQNARLVDYTGTLAEFQQMKGFGPDFVDMIRKSTDGAKAVVVVDRCFDSRFSGPLLVQDHMNLSGSNPLLGPNDPSGERFPVVQGVYLTDFFPHLRKVIIAGLKDGEKAGADELQFLRNLGVDACSYNMVPSMLIAAHAGWKVLGILLSDKDELSQQDLNQILTWKGSK